MDHNIQIFDRELLRLKRARCSINFEQADFLFRWTHENLRDRLSVIHREFDRVLQIGARGGRITNNAITADICDAFAPDIIMDEEFLAAGNATNDSGLDMVISALNIQAVNDLPGALLQIKNALKPDGLFIAAMFGGETLHQLRASLYAAEEKLFGGVSPRVFPFADKQDLGALMQRAGFALPVVDSEIITVTYEHIFKLLHDVRGMGEGNIIQARDKRYVGKDFFFEAAQHYMNHYAEDDGRIVATFEIIFLIGWAPHSSQQKPLTPGSAKERLADALQTQENKI